jgi:hypothetical protein
MGIFIKQKPGVTREIVREIVIQEVAGIEPPEAVGGILNVETEADLYLIENPSIHTIYLTEDTDAMWLYDRETGTFVKENDSIKELDAGSF